MELPILELLNFDWTKRLWNSLQPKDRVFASVDWKCVETWLL